MVPAAVEREGGGEDWDSSREDINQTDPFEVTSRRLTITP